jgi:hypothetical protein
MEWSGCQPGARIRDHKNALELRTGLVLADNMHQREEMTAFGAPRTLGLRGMLEGPVQQTHVSRCFIMQQDVVMYGPS